ncbi:hypothetical protein [Streptomyces mirabilis]|uniref:hypothetical protein n=1 Tax=Streptomyces mirabilis TaxID=68239 RepID=UPI0021C0C23E|nr:hypothetical protein [Streptomyces mirabilis]MCT9105304.1 hypothetical protein [Streptomyces mirabilis]
MSKPLSMDDLTVKFHSNRAGVSSSASVDCDETTIWQAPEGSLYRVVQRLDRAEFVIATLVSTGWIMLLTLDKEADGIANQDEAMNRWLDIQSLPPTSSSD